MVTQNHITYSTLINSLPYKIKLKFQNFSSFVEGVLDEKQPESGWSLSKEQIDEIKIITLTIALYKFFRQSSYVARQAAIEFEKLDMKGFSFGKTEFTKDNKNTNRGETLSRTLLEFVPNINSYIKMQNSLNLTQIITNLARRFSFET